MKKTRTVNGDGSWVEKSTEQQDSTEISCGKDGKMSWKVKTYDDDLTERKRRQDQAVKDVKDSIAKAE